MLVKAVEDAVHEALDVFEVAGRELEWGYEELGSQVREQVEVQSALATWEWAGVVLVWVPVGVIPFLLRVIPQEVRV